VCLKIGKVFPDQFIGIAVGRVGRKIEQPQPAVQALNKCFGLFGDMGRASIGELKIAAAASSPKQGADSPFAS